ncbi:MAG: 16S rRNA (uracil(1498)-N(3))-methyltransferase [Pseudomonadota bacterium]|nr:16S rRNA (uracil(1498)-N(3))-methyltransferase [Pseudomonadota bacterium]
MAARIFVPMPLAAGTVFSLPKGQSRHVQVLRLQPGDTIVLFNGDDGLEWPARIIRIDRQSVDLRIGDANAGDAAPVPLDRELPMQVTLALGVPANERMDSLVEKATELGVAAIQPLICERSVVRLAGDRADARRLHWSAVAASASEQSGRVRVPSIGSPLKLDAWLQSLPATTSSAAQSRLVLSFDRSAQPPAAVLMAHPCGSGSTWLVLSGPEGGLAPAEEERAVAAGFLRVSLGARVLRADTAPLALLAWLGLTIRLGA